MNILLVCPMKDQQTGIYLHTTLITQKHRVAYFDWREITEQVGMVEMNKELVKAVTQLKPDLTIICKGLGITSKTIEECKKINNKPIVGWIFDVTLGGTYVKDSKQYVSFIKSLDKFYTIDDEAVEELKALGVNADYAPEGCFPQANGEQVLNSYQRRQYGSDIVFVGSVGSIHPNRERILKKLYEDGFNLKIYGDVLYLEGQEPEWVKKCHTGYSAINTMHSTICQSAKIVLGIDGWPDRNYSWSARLYRVLCSNSFYLTTFTKGINEKFENGVYLDTYKNDEEMMEKLLKYLKNDDLRAKIAENGKKLVLEQYTFEQPLNKIIGDFYPTN